MELAAAVLVLGILSFLAFWRPVAPLFMILAGMSMMLGLRWYDIYTNETGMTFGLALIGYSLLCLGYTFKIIFWQGREEQGREG